MAAAAGPSAEDKAFEFSQGLYGFPDVKRFVITEVPGGGDLIKQMVALEQPDLVFTLVFPFAFFVDYAPEVPEAEAAELGVNTPDDLVVMVVANVAEQFRDTTVNLKAPILFNPHTRKGRQVILTDDRYTTRHRLFQA
ncbi:MAG TPA: flagellar assembly protein FliW [Symbiobacteriaceae bacterium]|jgi:flagellar assembly factor FliW|nr:flagellar assembly protein FliW [Symbiobacteriaceae bacterium]